MAESNYKNTNRTHTASFPCHIKPLKTPQVTTLEHHLSHPINKSWFPALQPCTPTMPSPGADALTSVLYLRGHCFTQLCDIILALVTAAPEAIRKSQVFLPHIHLLVSICIADVQLLPC